MKIRSIFLAFFLIASADLCADIIVHVEKGLVNQNQKDNLISLIHNLKKHFDFGHKVNTVTAKKDWMQLSASAKNLDLFIITDSHTFICLNNKHKSSLRLQNIAPIKSYKNKPNEFNNILKTVMSYTKVEDKNSQINWDKKLGKNIIEKIREYTTNNDVDASENNNNDFNDNQTVDIKEETIEDKPGVFAIRIDKTIADDDWYAHSESNLNELVSLIYHTTRTKIEDLSALNNKCKSKNIIIITDQRTYAICLHAKYDVDIKEFVSSCTPAYSHLKVFTPSNEQAKPFKELVDQLQEYTIKWDNAVSINVQDIFNHLVEQQTQKQLEKIGNLVSEYEEELSADEYIQKMISEFHEVEPEHEEPIQGSWWNWVPLPWKSSV